MKHLYLTFLLPALNIEYLWTISRLGGTPKTMIATTATPVAQQHIGNIIGYGNVAVVAAVTTAHAWASVSSGNINVRRINLRPQKQ